MMISLTRVSDGPQPQLMIQPLAVWTHHSKLYVATAYLCALCVNRAKSHICRPGWRLCLVLEARQWWAFYLKAVSFMYFWLIVRDSFKWCVMMISLTRVSDGPQPQLMIQPLAVWTHLFIMNIYPRNIIWCDRPCLKLQNAYLSFDIDCFLVKLMASRK